MECLQDSKEKRVLITFIMINKEREIKHWMDEIAGRERSIYV